MNGIFAEFDQGLLNCAGRDKTNGRGGGQQKNVQNRRRTDSAKTVHPITFGWGKYRVHPWVMLLGNMGKLTCHTGTCICCIDVPVHQIPP